MSDFEPLRIACDALDTAADLFEASPKQVFTRLEIIRILRGMRDEMSLESVTLSTPS